MNSIKARMSHESCLSNSTDETYDPDSAGNNIIFISPEHIHELISKSFLLDDKDKICIQNILWLVFTKHLDKNIAKDCILNIIRKDKNVCENFHNYIEQCEIFNIS